MGYKLLGMFVWNGGKLFAKVKLRGTSAGQRAGAAAGLLAVAGIFALVLSRGSDDDE
ncbi:MAG TPA: hypothetical protein VHR88_11025 [Solirubrobacteraceae bacterium]|jgi:hypothetical protein|nr:hypothetical protein [Solirubrobacteraceae bacterium]